MIGQDCFKFHLFFSISSLSLTLNAFEPFLSAIGAKNLEMNVGFWFLKGWAQAKWIG